MDIGTAGEHKMSHEKEAITLAAELVRIWKGWGTQSEVQSNLDLRSACKEFRAVDLHQVDGVLAQPLNYFVGAVLDGRNDEDLTYGEMLDSIELGLSLIGGQQIK